ncbi:MAG: hypothetical protein LC775_10975 [Acidobacteria bacterium]|nr:hypothetical protein [Acidobacteriota bacterium]
MAETFARFLFVMLGFNGIRNPRDRGRLHKTFRAVVRGQKRFDLRAHSFIFTTGFVDKVLTFFRLLPQGPVENSPDFLPLRVSHTY